MQLRKFGLMLATLFALGTATTASALEAGEISNPRVKYENGNIMFVVDVANTSNGRLQGALCVAMYDGDGFVVDRTRVGSTLNMGKGDIAEIADSWPMPADQFEDVNKMDFYLAAYCAAAGGDVLSAVTTIPKPQ